MVAKQLSLSSTTARPSSLTKTGDVNDQNLKLIWLSASDEQRNEVYGVLEEVHVLVHHAVHDQESVGLIRKIFSIAKDGSHCVPERIVLGQVHVTLRVGSVV